MLKRIRLDVDMGPFFQTRNTKLNPNTRERKIRGCEGRECHLKSHSESANHWSLCPHKITEAYCALRVSVLSVHHHPSQNSCQKHPYYADVNGICTCVRRANQTEIVS